MLVLSNVFDQYIQMATVFWLTLMTLVVKRNCDFNQASYKLSFLFYGTLR